MRSRSWPQQVRNLVVQTRLTHRVLGRVGAAGRDSYLNEELREGRKVGLSIQMMLSGGDRILAGPGKMGRQMIKLRLSFWERET